MNLENEAAQVEAEKCGVIAKDVTELQARCEKDLAAAEPLVAQAEAALDTLNKKDLGMPFIFDVRCSDYMQFSHFQYLPYEMTAVPVVLQDYRCLHHLSLHSFVGYLI